MNDIFLQPPHLASPASGHPLSRWCSQSSAWPGRVDLTPCGNALGCPPWSPRLVTSLYSFCNLLIVWSLFLADCGENWEVSLLCPLKGPKDPRSRIGSLPPPHPFFCHSCTGLHACMNFHMHACTPPMCT